jgi:hypothetical protein
LLRNDGLQILPMVDPVSIDAVTVKEIDKTAPGEMVANVAGHANDQPQLT